METPTIRYNNFWTFVRTILRVPSAQVWRPFRKPLDVYRADGGELATRRLLKKGWYAGGRLYQPVRPKICEIILIWLGVIR